MSNWPNNVGICNIEVYIPKYFVSQEKLEIFDGVSTGKYTIGLGQKNMGFFGDLEDINSLCLTVVHNLLENHKIDPKTIGRLEVGTETIIDKSKSVKTVLMQLFERYGNTDIEGVDTKNACYGGTSALFNAINWIESSYWDGRLAIVVTADIAVYAAGNARCTGGGGAIALVVGPNAPLVFDRGLRATHMAHVYDFYKPNLSSEYPVINGKLSVSSYLSALDNCYSQYRKKFMKKFSSEFFSLADIDFMVFHTPYCKLVQKSVARCMLQDFLNVNGRANGKYPLFEKYSHLSLNESLEDFDLLKEIERVSVAYSLDIFHKKTQLSTKLASLVGNMYTSSLYGSLVSLLMNVGENDLIGKRVLLFSYGSGLASSMFSLTVCPSENLRSSLVTMLDSLQSINVLLDQRLEIEPEKFVNILELREKSSNVPNFSPTCSPIDLVPGTYYLTKINSEFKRYYERKEKEG
ncbi:hydroxymethylglutaryl-CoA synthase 1 isoform X2 [Hydra vulgaris]|uniref:Hydroxymethylglutaryl-CoA synthase n=1 Tax=Hydra vulgaris TaxID=6087 RepID=A0ABM4BC20_HYDVU